MRTQEAVTLIFFFVFIVAISASTLTVNITGEKNVTVTENSQIRVKCAVGGSPRPRRTWIINGREIKCKALFAQYCIYNVKEAQYPRHNGVLTCLASSNVGSVNTSVYINVKAKPVIIDWKQEIYLLSDSKNVTCKSVANPAANVSWFYQLGTNQRRYLSSKKSINTITLKPKKDARYFCEAKNNQGNVTKELFVNIITPAPVSNHDVQKNDVTIVVVSTIAGVLVLSLTITVFWLKRRYAKYLRPNSSFQIDPNRSLFEQSGDLPYDLVWEFPRKRLFIQRMLGSGAFGDVMLAEASGIIAFKPREKKSASFIAEIRHWLKSLSCNNKDELPKSKVAVKKLKDNPEPGAYKDLATELKILIHVGEHKNIINLKGACTMAGPLYVILEYCPHGNLMKFLQTRRDFFEPEWKKHHDIQKKFTYCDMICFSLQISEGMNFLQSKKCVHRDLAARNVLVGENYIMKISDFGMARDVTSTNYYRKETTGLIPIKWMAPESFLDPTRVYTSMSDVWSFGVLLWEIFSLGGSPYHEVANEEFFNYIRSGRRLLSPKYCPTEVYDIMHSCWKENPKERPNFIELNDELRYCMEEATDNDPENHVKDDDLSLSPLESLEEEPLLVRNEETHSTRIPEDDTRCEVLNERIAFEGVIQRNTDSQNFPKGNKYVADNGNIVSARNQNDHGYEGIIANYEDFEPGNDVLANQELLSPQDDTRIQNESIPHNETGDDNQNGNYALEYLLVMPDANCYQNDSI